MDVRSSSWWLLAALTVGACGDDVPSVGESACPQTCTGSATTDATDGAAAGSTGGTQGTPSTADASAGSDGSGTGGGAGPLEYPDPGDWEPNAGPGGPAVAFDEADLYTECAFLLGGPGDFEHHNLVQMFDGYLVMPWAPEWAGGGLSFFDVSDPCNPVEIGVGSSDKIRESHAIGFAEVGARRFALLAFKNAGLFATQGGVGFWDITDPSAPFDAARIEIPGHFYPDAYARVVLSAFWQYPYVYVGASENGIFVIDASDPMNPSIVGEYDIQPVMRTGQVQVIGNLLVATAAEGPRTVLLDVSIPELPQPIAGGDFEIADSMGVNRESYFSNVSGGLVWYAIKSGGGGVLAYDIRDPSAPTLAGHYDSGGNGGYVFVKEHVAFVGESNFAGVYDVSDPAAMTQIVTLNLPGDLDTITPIGNVAVLSVDDEAMPGMPTSIVPFRAEVDTQPPVVEWSVPSDGATDLAVTSRFGVMVSEFVDPRSAWFGSVRVYRTDDDGTVIPVDGTPSVQENIVNFRPNEALLPGTEYTFEIPAGGITDHNGNPIEETFSITFTTREG